MAASDTAAPLGPTDRRRRLALGVLVLAWGVQAIVTQSLLLREALVLMFGSEFAWGVVLFAWLFGVAAGAALGGWAAGRLSRPDIGLVVVLLLLSAAACFELWIFRGARAWLGVGQGELLPLPKSALAAMLFVSPTSALIGLAFPLACCIPRATDPRASARADDPRGLKPAAREVLQLGNVYALESAGSLIGGAAFSFWAVEHLTPIETALACGVITAAASAGFMAVTGRCRYSATGLGAVAVAVLLVAVFAGDALNGRLVERRWQNVAPGYELVAEAESKYQNLAVARRAEQFTLYCDGHVSADFPDPYTFVPLAHFWLCQHPQPRDVLVVGGGAEGLLAEILRHPVEHIDYVEPDPRQIALIEPYLADTDRQALADPRVTVHHLDARYYVKTQRARFDLVIARLPEPTSALRARFFTDEFYHELRRAMKPQAVLCTTVTAAPGELSPVSGEYLASVRATLARHFPHLVIGWGDPAQVLAATQPGLLSTDPAELADRYTQRGIEADLFDPAWFDGATDWLEPDKLARRAAELEAVTAAQVSTDLRPLVYIQRLVLWDRMTGGQSGRVIEWLRSVRLEHLIAALAAVMAITLILFRLRARRPDGWAGGAIVVSIGTTGLATMALSIVWLFAFQNLYGYVYQRIGWIIAVFMGGLVIGCALANWRANRVGNSAVLRVRPEPHRAAGFSPRGPSNTTVSGSTLNSYLRRRLIGVDVLLALGAVAVPFVLPRLSALQSSPLALLLVEWCVLIMVALTGVLGGAAFALAGRLQLRVTGRVAAAAASVDAADHAGACLGALLCGILLVPVFGTATAAFLLCGLKLTSAAILTLACREGALAVACSEA